MRIALLFSSAERCQTIARNLRTHGQDVLIVPPSIGSLRLRRMLRRNRVEILHAHGPGTSRRARWATIASSMAVAVSDQSLASELLKDYESARFRKNYPFPIPVLMYHQIVDRPVATPHRIFVTEASFRRHLEWFRRWDMTTLTFTDLLDFKQGRRPMKDFPFNPVILTFDDGYEDNLTRALPLLQEFQCKAVIFLLADLSLTRNTWDEGTAPQVSLLSSEQRQALAKSDVFEIGSHGFRHQRLPAMSDSEALHELRESKIRLEAEFARPIHAFAFTYGDIDERSARLARQAGYAYAVNTDSGGITIEENPWAVFRTSIFPHDGRWALRKKTRYWYRWAFQWKRGR